MAVDVEATISGLEQKLAEQPTSLAFTRLADAFRKQGDIGKAVEVCRNGLDVHPDSVTGRIILARCYIEQENPTGAIAEFIAVCRHDRKNVVAIKMLADIYSKQGLDEKAGDLYAYLSRIQPHNQWFSHLASHSKGSGKIDLREILDLSQGSPPHSQQQSGVSQSPSGEATLIREETAPLPRSEKKPALDDTLTTASLPPEHGETVELATFDPADVDIEETVDDIGESEELISGDDISRRVSAMFDEDDEEEVSPQTDEISLNRQKTLRGDTPDSLSPDGEGDDISSRIEELFSNDTNDSFDADIAPTVAFPLPTPPSEFETRGSETPTAPPTGVSPDSSDESSADWQDFIETVSSSQPDTESQVGELPGETEPEQEEKQDGVTEDTVPSFEVPHEVRQKDESEVSVDGRTVSLPLDSIVTDTQTQPEHDTVSPDTIAVDTGADDRNQDEVSTAKKNEDLDFPSTVSSENIFDNVLFPDDSDDENPLPFEVADEELTEQPIPLNYQPSGDDISSRIDELFSDEAVDLSIEEPAASQSEKTRIPGVFIVDEETVREPDQLEQTVTGARAGGVIPATDENDKETLSTSKPGLAGETIQVAPETEKEYEADTIDDRSVKETSPQHTSPKATSSTPLVDTYKGDEVPLDDTVIFNKEVSETKVVSGDDVASRLSEIFSDDESVESVFDSLMDDEEESEELNPGFYTVNGDDARSGNETCNDAEGVPDLSETMEVDEKEISEKIDDVVAGQSSDEEDAAGGDAELTISLDNGGDAAESADMNDMSETTVLSRDADDRLPVVSGDDVTQRLESIFPDGMETTDSIPEDTEEDEEGEPPSELYTIRGTSAATAGEETDEALECLDTVEFDGIIEEPPEPPDEEQEDIAKTIRMELPGDGDEVLPSFSDKPAQPKSFDEKEEEPDQERAVEETSFTEGGEPVSPDDSMLPDHVLTPTLADIYFQQGQHYLAKRIYERLLKRDPDNERIVSRLEEIDAKSSAEQGQPEIMPRHRAPTMKTPVFPDQTEETISDDDASLAVTREIDTESTDIPEFTKVSKSPGDSNKPKRSSRSTTRKRSRKKRNVAEKPLKGVKIKKHIRERLQKK